ncbi:MAG: beta-ketoacyl-[acyl-carrier-protein] synthase family protein, partial [Lachnospiraceae bacterium]|nr:beta-ketoacyl-[acyl-carrier-protein] synthase family protein [Lachnospiraceae bacterium]
ADAVLVVGAESAISPLTIRGLASAHALSTNNEKYEIASRPFDRDRDGFVMGEGGGAVLLETEEHALARKADIKAELAGFANSTDGYHITSPHPEGIGAIFCMQGAIKHAEISAEEVDYINTHGTSTPMGDPIEVKAIKQLFGTHAKEIAVNSTKGATGHMMGAGGITEAITCIQAIRTGIVPPTLHLDNVDPACEGLNLVPKEAQKKNVKVAMSNSFGFGGQNSSVLFKRYA